MTRRTSVAAEENIHSQLEMFGIDSLRARIAASDKMKAGEKREAIKRLEAAHRTMSEPLPDEIGWMHAGLCQTNLPYERLKSNNDVWHRANGRFHLTVEPGTVIDPSTGKPRWVGVPYGTRARLIMFYLNTYGRRSPVVPLGKSMSAWMRRLGLQVTGGKTGTIQAVKEQALRLGRARFSLTFENYEEGKTGIEDTQIADKLALWVTDDKAQWVEEIELTQKFHTHLREHAVPLSDHAISYLSRSNLKLDVYAWAAWKLPKLRKSVKLNWHQIAQIFAADLTPTEAWKISERMRDALQDVYTVYRDMRVDVDRFGLILHPSNPPIPKTFITYGGGTDLPRPKQGQLAIE